MIERNKPFAGTKGNHKSGSLNEWGIPDYRDLAGYGQVGDWTRDRWRWEFSRLREDLRLRTHNQNMTVAARAIAERKTVGDLS
jgi:hypothetical protein